MSTTKGLLARPQALNDRQERFFKSHDLITLLLRPPERLVHPYTWAGHIPFAQTLVRMMKPRIFVELGTHSGNSFCAFCQALRDEGLETAAYAVDTWQGDGQAGFYADTVYNDLAPFVETAYGQLAHLLRMTFDEGLERFNDNSVDLLHIDGLHTYDAVRHDYEAWERKLSPCGVVLFHDTQVFDRGFGVHRLWKELRADHPGFEFLHSHGLGLLMVGSEVAPALADFVDLADDDPGPIRSLFERVSQIWLPDEALAYQRRFSSDPPREAVSLDAELYLDCGQGYSENKKLISLLRLEQGKGVLQFELGHFSDRLLGLRFDPGSEAIALHGISAWSHGTDGSLNKLEIYRTSAIVSDHGVLFFGNDPWVEFALPHQAIKEIQIELQVKATGKPLIDLLIGFAGRVVGLEAEMAEKVDSAKKLWNDLTEKDRLLEKKEALIEKLWNYLTEKDRLLEKKEALIEKLWNDLTEKDRLLEKKEALIEKLWNDMTQKDTEIARCQHSIDLMQATLDGLGRHSIYRLLSKLGLMPLISEAKKEK